MNQRFEARYKISEGGNGLIRAGRDLQLSRDVAIKELRPCRSGEVERARLLREAHIQAQLQHPCMVPVYGIGQWDDGSPYYVMQQLSGMTLYDAVIALHASRSKKVILHCKTIEGAQIHLSFRDLIGRFKELCLAVEFAHQQGVIHRDITPKNLMLGYYGENHIIDWGTAKIESEQPEHAQQESLIPVATGSLHATSPSIESIGSQSLGAMLSASRQNMRTFTGAILGTPGFMSPEHQISAKNVDRLSDVFGLGATLYFIVAGRPPRNADLLKEKGGTGNLPNPKEHILTPSSKVQKRVDSQLEAIYLRAMNAKPELRYKSCRELADDLGRWLNGQPVRAREETLREKTKRWIRQRSASAIVAVVFIASGGAMLQHYFHAR
ncbi:MAG: serine/threonine protein kinase, partial [Planctomycetales bacterium]|nr:serine/threonine protein kinase [Planctomycetales bacterium]